VARRVGPVVVDPVEAGAGERLRADVVKEVHEPLRLAPAVAHGDAAGAVELELAAVGVVAPLQHAAPDLVFRRRIAVPAVAVLAWAEGVLRGHGSPSVAQG